jgi:uncharacterized protein YndB with AHSA1/START domain
MKIRKKRATDMDANNPEFELTRRFRHPRAAVWSAWSDPDKLQTWWGPKGCSVKMLDFEFRAGGFFHYSMIFPGAAEMYGRFNFRDIAPPDRIVWLNSFANQDCGIARAPFSDKCPLEILNTVTFTEEAGTTTQLLRATPFGATADERKFFVELCSSGSLNQGFGGTFDQLSDYLDKA